MQAMTTILKTLFVCLFVYLFGAYRSTREFAYDWKKKQKIKKTIQAIKIIIWMLKSCVVIVNSRLHKNDFFAMKNMSKRKKYVHVFLKW